MAGSRGSAQTQPPPPLLLLHTSLLHARTLVCCCLCTHRTMDVAVEDVNILLSDLELGVRPQAEDITFAKSSSLVVEQVRILEQAFSESPDHAAAAEGVRSDAGIVDVAVARGMPRPAGGIDDSTARCVCFPPETGCIANQHMRTCGLELHMYSNSSLSVSLHAYGGTLVS